MVGEAKGVFVSAQPINGDIWHTEAACRGPYHAVFFPPSRLERRVDRRRREQRAKEICSQCSVLDQCREYALEIREQHGIWGGLTERERRQRPMAEL